MKNIYKEFKKIQLVLDKQYDKQFIKIFLSMLLIAVFEVLSIGVILPFFDVVLNVDNMEEHPYLFKIKTFFNIESNHFVLLIGLVVIFTFLIKNTILFFVHRMQARNLHVIRVDMSKKMFRKYVDMDYSLFMEKNISSMMYNSTGVINLFVLIYLHSLLYLISELVVVISIVILLFTVNIKAMLIISTFALFIIFVLLRKFKRAYKSIGKEEYNATIQMNKIIHEGIGALKEIKTLDIENYFIELFDKHSKTYQRTAVQNSTLQVIPRLFLEFIFITILVCVVVVSLLLKVNLQELIPALILFTIAFFKILPSLNRIINLYNQLLARQVSLDVLYEELVINNTFVSKVESGEKDVSFKNVISIKNITFSYNKSDNIFKNFSLEIPKNTTVAFVGKSGSGKTTLVDIILGLLIPQRGHVRFDQYEVSKNLKFWYKTIAYIPQSISFIDDSIRNNIALGVHDIDEKQLRKVIKDAQLEELIDSLPSGLNTIIGDKGIKLSGGQLQRIGIARALYKNPSILVFDEATSALDVETERAITESIKKLGDSKTIIIIAHRLSTIKSSDRIFMFENGKIKDSGTYAELLARNRWFQRINI